MSGQQAPAKKKYVWDYMRGGGGKRLFSPLINRFAPSPDTLRQKIEAEKLKQELAALKKRKGAPERRVDM